MHSSNERNIPALNVLCTDSMQNYILPYQLNLFDLFDNLLQSSQGRHSKFFKINFVNLNCVFFHNIYGVPWVFT